MPEREQAAYEIALASKRTNLEGQNDIALQQILDRNPDSIGEWSTTPPGEIGVRPGDIQKMAKEILDGRSGK